MLPHRFGRTLPAPRSSRSDIMPRMHRDQVTQKLESLIETLAAVEHERWSHWQRHLHEKSARQSDGSLLIPAHLVQQWENQIATPYSQLSEKEKESDREQARKYIPL